LQRSLLDYCPPSMGPRLARRGIATAWVTKYSVYGNLQWVHGSLAVVSAPTRSPRPARTSPFNGSTARSPWYRPAGDGGRGDGRDPSMGPRLARRGIGFIVKAGP